MGSAIQFGCKICDYAADPIGEEQVPKVEALFAVSFRQSCKIQRFVRRHGSGTARGRDAGVAAGSARPNLSGGAALA